MTTAHVFRFSDHTVVAPLKGAPLKGVRRVIRVTGMLQSENIPFLVRQSLVDMEILTTYSPEDIRKFISPGSRAAHLHDVLAALKKGGKIIEYKMLSNAFAARGLQSRFGLVEFEAETFEYV
ncbi:MAG TPA: hypothetical protein VD928_00115 [Candidatus Paceibacterota bacterium]|nr:hypothetical protein [Candidatus Paceibacterota bacterium]